MTEYGASAETGAVSGLSKINLCMMISPGSPADAGSRQRISHDMREQVKTVSALLLAGVFSRADKYSRDDCWCREA